MRARSMRRVPRSLVRMPDGTHRYRVTEWLPAPTRANPWCERLVLALTCPLPGGAA